MHPTMKLVSIMLCVAAALVEPVVTKCSNPLGIDVSSNNGRDIDWSGWKSKGYTFAYIKATEGSSKS